MAKQTEPEPVILPPEVCLLEQWRPAFRLALAWCRAAGMARAMGDEEKAEEYLQHGLDIFDTLEARL